MLSLLLNSLVFFLLFFASIKTFAGSVYVGELSLSHPEAIGQFLQDFNEKYELNKDYEIIHKTRNAVTSLRLRHKDQWVQDSISSGTLDATVNQISHCTANDAGSTFTVNIFNPKYEVVHFGSETQEQMESSATLFSENYGKWGEEARRYRLKPGKNVAMGVDKLRDGFMFDDHCGLVRAIIPTQKGDKQVGHAFFRKFDVEGLGQVVWITQLVVDSNYRGKEIATNLIHQALKNKYGACGLASSHPYAVRSIEAATRLVCDPKSISAYAQTLIQHCDIPYIQGKSFESKDRSCIINTDFFVDHTELLGLLENEKLNPTRPWNLGSLPEGHEFLAFVFSESHLHKPKESSGP